MAQVRIISSKYANILRTQLVHSYLLFTNLSCGQFQLTVEIDDALYKLSPLLRLALIEMGRTLPCFHFKVIILHQAAFCVFRVVRVCLSVA